MRLLVSFILCVSLSFGQFGTILLEDFQGSNYTNIDGTSNMWDQYNGEDSGQIFTFNDSGRMKVVGSTDTDPPTDCDPTGCGIYWDFDPYPYLAPEGFMKHWIKSGTWSSSINKLSFWMKCSNNQARYGSGIGNSYVGTYVKGPLNTLHGNKGQHYYHNLNFTIRSQNWIYIEVGSNPTHVVGGCNECIPEVDPEWVDPTAGAIHYWDGMNRWYWESTGGDTWSGQTCWFDEIWLKQVDDDNDYWVTGGIAAQYRPDTGKYEVTWNGRPNSNKVYDVRYSTSSMKVNGFTSGTVGGTATGTADTNLNIQWDSPTMAQADIMYFAIRPQGETLFTEVMLPADGPDWDGSGGEPPAVTPSLNIGGKARIVGRTSLPPQ